MGCTSSLYMQILGDMYNSQQPTTKLWIKLNNKNNTTELEAFKIGMTLMWIATAGRKWKKSLEELRCNICSGNHDWSKQNWMAQALNLYFINNPNRVLKRLESSKKIYRVLKKHYLITVLDILKNFGIEL